MPSAKTLQMIALRQPILCQTRHVAQRSVVSINYSPNNASCSHSATPHPLPSRPSLASFQTRHYSRTNTLQVFNWMRDKFEQSEKTKQAAKLVDQINLMANTPVWTVQHFKDEVDETLSGWRSKVPGAQVQGAKDTQKVVSAMVSQLGSKATAQDVVAMDRKQKLQLSISCEMTMDEVNVFLEQFKSMELMHRILRYRKENGIALPTNADGLKMAMQQDGIKVMTNAEKREMREKMGKAQQKSESSKIRA
jgi:hypothetical protein